MVLEEIKCSQGLTCVEVFTYSMAMATRHSKNQHEVLHVLDVENLNGSPYLTSQGCVAIAQAYAATYELGETPEVVLATTSAQGIVETQEAWPTARRLVQFGPDGADLALIDVLHNENIPSRYRKVVIGSGDHIFAEAASWLQTKGCEVIVVSRQAALSRKLRFAVKEIYLLPEPPTALAGWMAA